MTFAQGTVSVTTAATAICTPNSNSGILIVNNGSQAVYIGGSTVTADTTATCGIKVASGSSITIPTCAGDANATLYAITATSTATVSYITALFTSY